MFTIVKEVTEHSVKHSMFYFFTAVCWNCCPVLVLKLHKMWCQVSKFIHHGAFVIQQVTIQYVRYKPKTHSLLWWNSHLSIIVPLFSRVCFLHSLSVIVEIRNLFHFIVWLSKLREGKSMLLFECCCHLKIPNIVLSMCVSNVHCYNS